MGLLIVEGRIDIAQYWPLGESDADTTKVTVDRFLFSPTEDEKAAKVTTIFEGAKCRGKVSKEVIDKKGRITVRWQGIDAAELHYQAQAEVKKDDPALAKKKEAFHAVNKRYRQHLGETATVRLQEKIQALAGAESTIPCRVTTYVEHPGEVCDTYGRFVGNIIVGDNHDLNLWLVENGWAFPTFYSSMRSAEIEAFLLATRKAKGKGIWRHYSHDLSTFEWNLVYEKGPFNEKADTGPVVMPKMFRRLVAFRTNKKSGIISGTFERYLRAKNPPEACFLTADFLQHGITAATPHFIYEFVKSSNITARPEDLIFQEAPSTLVDGDGKKITNWF